MLYFCSTVGFVFALPESIDRFIAILRRDDTSIAAIQKWQASTSKLKISFKTKLSRIKSDSVF